MLVVHSILVSSFLFVVGSNLLEIAKFLILFLLARCSFEAFILFTNNGGIIICIAFILIEIYLMVI